ncbi:MAG: hypothetical protein U0441_07915 [Polyangiaceae bacterium]
MKALPLGLAAFLFAAAASAEEPAGPETPPIPPRDARPTYAQAMSLHALFGLGGIPGVRSMNGSLTTEFGSRPFHGNNNDPSAFSTGIGYAVTSDFNGKYSILSLGLFAKLDLTYVFLSGFWTHPFAPDFPFRVQAGGRLSISMSDSFGGLVRPYTLVRPEVTPFVDLEIVANKARTTAFVLRAAYDDTLDIEQPRYTVAIGLDYGWKQ